MSTTASFTSRDINRQPAKVLDAARRLGSVEIRTRNGDTFILTRKKGRPKQAKAPDFEARGRRLRELGLIPPPPSQNERINRIIAGEE